MSVGSRIKELRKKRGMTQADLADGVITRGMLSRIENGTALPSLQSLQGIAEKLSVSSAFLLDEQSNLLIEERKRIVHDAIVSCQTGQYEDAYAALKKSGIEMTAMLAGIFVYSAFQAGCLHFYAGEFGAADTMLRDAKACLTLPVPPVEAVTESRIDLLQNIMANISDPEAILRAAGDTPDFGFEPALFLSLAKRMQTGNAESVFPLVEFCHLSQPYQTYLQAQRLVASYRFVDAILAMKALIQTPDVPLFLSLLCTASIEKCCKLCEDYKGAYENQLRYQKLLREIKK